MQQFTPLSEWSAPPTKLEDFVLGAAWQALPFDIQVALAHIWLAEQEASQVSERLLWTTASVGKCSGTFGGDPCPPAEGFAVSDQPASSVSRPVREGSLLKLLEVALSEGSGDQDCSLHLARSSCDKPGTQAGRHPRGLKRSGHQAGVVGAAANGIPAR